MPGLEPKVSPVRRASIMRWSSTTSKRKRLWMTQSYIAAPHRIAARRKAVLDFVANAVFKT
jgi:hypothetical protein